MRSHFLLRTWSPGKFYFIMKLRGNVSTKYFNISIPTFQWKVHFSSDQCGCSLMIYWLTHKNDRKYCLKSRKFIKTFVLMIIFVEWNVLTITNVYTKVITSKRYYSFWTRRECFTSFLHISRLKIKWEIKSNEKWNFSEWNISIPNFEWI